MGSEDEPTFDAAITDLRGQQHRPLFVPDSRIRRWRWGAGVLLLLGLLVAGQLVWAARPLVQQSQAGKATPPSSTGAASSPADPSVFRSPMVRPLRFPIVTSLANCPVSIGRTVSPNLGLAAGTGPLFIVAVDANGNVDYVPPGHWGDNLGLGGMAETLWIFPPGFSGPVLVRGQRLDAAGKVWFNSVNGPALPQLQMMVPLDPSSPPYKPYGGWYIRFNTPGCYGLQVDWSRGTERIIFRAEPGQ
jgi:hypothetical protein